MRKKDDALNSVLLNAARNIADTEGIEAINIRSIAQKAGIASGTVYNYFSNKDEILLALTEEYWKQALLEMNTEITATSFYEQVEEIYAFLKKQMDRSAAKLMNSLKNVEPEGSARMTSLQSELEAALLQRMECDTAVRKDIWNEVFTKTKFVRFIVMNLTMLLKARAPDIDFFITIIKHIIYSCGGFNTPTLAS